MSPRRGAVKRQPNIHTYLVTNEAGQTKIGRSNDPANRLRSLQSGSSQRLHLAATLAVDIEQQLHAAFMDRRGSGEWFDISPADVQVHPLWRSRGEPSLPPQPGVPAYLLRHPLADMVLSFFTAHAQVHDRGTVSCLLQGVSTSTARIYGRKLQVERAHYVVAECVLANLDLWGDVQRDDRGWFHRASALPPDPSYLAHPWREHVEAWLVDDLSRDPVRWPCIAVLASHEIVCGALSTDYVTPDDETAICGIVRALPDWREVNIQVRGGRVHAFAHFDR
jgi:hypothetical protein